MLRSARTIGCAALFTGLLGCTGGDLLAPTASIAAPVASDTELAAEASSASRLRRGNTAGTAFDSATTAMTALIDLERRAVNRTPTFRLTPRLFGDATSASTCLPEGTQAGAWNVRYHGYGCVSLEQVAGQTTLYMAPTEATAEEYTHAPLAVGPEHRERLTLSARFETISHTRRGGAPNPWEVAWLVWHFADDEHFYYFIPKPNGWELGKRDPAYIGGQRFLATGTDRTFPIGRIYQVTVQQRGDVMTVFVDGEQIVQFRDTERPYRAGRVALYSEDAAIRVHDVASL